MLYTTKLTCKFLKGWIFLTNLNNKYKKNLKGIKNNKTHRLIEKKVLIFRLTLKYHPFVPWNLFDCLRCTYNKTKLEKSWHLYISFRFCNVHWHNLVNFTKYSNVILTVIKNDNTAKPAGAFLALLKCFDLEMYVTICIWNNEIQCDRISYQVQDSFIRDRLYNAKVLVLVIFS